MTQSKKDLSNELEARLRFEMMLAEISTGFINMPADQVDGAIQDAMRRICTSLEIDIAALWQFSDEAPGFFALTHLYSAPESLQPSRQLRQEDFPWFAQQLQAGRIVAISSLEELPAEAARDRESSRQLGVKSNVTLPLAVGGVPPFGILGLNATRVEREWSDTLIKQFQLVAQVFANALARKRAEDALRESEARLTLATDSAEMGLWIMNIDTRQVWVTPKIRELFQFTSDQVILYDTFLIAIHPEDREHVRNAVQKTLQSGEGLRIEYRIVLRDGTVRWIVSRGRAHIDSAGKPDSLVGVSMNFTERKQTEEALTESQARMSAIVENTNDLIWSVDAKRFGLITFNAALHNYFFHGRSLEIQLGMTPDDMLPPYYAALWREFYTRTLQQGAFVTEYYTSAKTHVLLLSFNLLKRGRDVFGVSVFGRDITDRKRAEEELRLSEERFRQVAESVSDFIWEVDAKGLYRYTSPAVEKILGYTPDELIGKMHFYDLFAPDIREELKAAAFKAFTAKESYRGFPNANVSKDGKIVHLETSGVPMTDEAGNLTGYRGSDTDVTERKNAGEALQHAFSEIKQLKEQLEAENIYLREDIKMERNFDDLIGQSDGMRYIQYRMEQVAGTDATVLVLGETGTGKGVVAHAIHGRSIRKDRPLITVNCAALPANLIESELFGREKGAFTGSHTRQLGRFEIADKGTIFLDEIGELPLELQAKLLRVIQDGEFERLGSPHTIKVDVRIIASTSRNLRDEIAKGRFREDLYYRLNVFPITIPPLRQRQDDIPLLADHFLKKFSHKLGREITSIPGETMKSLQNYAWPGNIRELEHVIERAVITSRGSVLQLAEKIDDAGPHALSVDPLSISDVEREHILKVLKETNWRIEGSKGAATFLGLNPSTLRSRMQKLGISRPDQNSSTN